MNNRPTPAEQAPTTPVGALPGPRINPSSEARDLRHLLAVVLDALTLDFAVDNYSERLKERACLARVVIRDGLDEPAWNADWLHSKLRAEEADVEAKAVRASVDRAFPTVAAFLADERGEGK
ncbi:hypothetical protein R6V09_01200 [Streptomyces sp. W16]|uniref:hypothetical protein n=1 Tax=Streptomyces sp. W16 TaxID=3076631 RepID=UPI00295A8F5C|nr:hypothetical protein [Streptomyces sp. W16]MDV9168760.1 hypothetical protein [Streptomyces sp. W16]